MKVREARAILYPLRVLAIVQYLRRFGRVNVAVRRMVVRNDCIYSFVTLAFGGRVLLVDAFKDENDVLYCCSTYGYSHDRGSYRWGGSFRYLFVIKVRPWLQALR